MDSGFLWAVYGLAAGMNIVIMIVLFRFVTAFESIAESLNRYLEKK